MLNKLVAEMATSYCGGDCLLRRVRDLLEPARGAGTGRRAGPPDPVTVQVLDFLMLVEAEVYQWEWVLRRLLGWPGRERRRDEPDALLHALRALPSYADRLDVAVIPRAVLRDVQWWHSRSLEFVGVSQLEQRYQPTEQAAQCVGKSVDAFRTYMRRHRVEPVGHLPSPRRGHTTRTAIWDMREVQTAVGADVRVLAGG